MRQKKSSILFGSTVLRRTILAVSIMELFIGAGSAIAQTPPSIPNTGTEVPAPVDKEVAPDATMNTVVVTASRRSETAREVAMKVNTLSTDNLQRTGATQLIDYLTSQPGVSFDSGGGTGQGTISIRGVTAGKDVGPTVGVYVDDASFGPSTVYGGGAALALDMGLLDLNHIEILFGPQGTVYGAGAMGGLLKYVTNVPVLDSFEGQVGASISSTANGSLNYSTNAILNIPLKTDVAAIRVSAFKTHDGGYIDAARSGDTRINKVGTKGGRASVLIKPSENLTMRLTATAQDIDSDGLNFASYKMNGSSAFGDLKRDLGSSEAAKQSIRFYTGEIEYDFGAAKLKSVTSSQSLENDSPRDANFYMPIFASRGLAFGAVQLGHVNKTDKLTQEFRLTSSKNDLLEWVGGIYYNREDNIYRDVLQGAAAGSNVFSALQTFGIVTAYKERAAYGNVTYHMSPRFDLNAGIRVARNDQDYNQSTFGPIVQHSVTVPGESSDTSKTYMFTAGYKLTPTSNLYARAASGYRPGGPNVVAISPVTGLVVPGLKTFNPDTLWNYEVGYKADLLDRKLSVAISAYDIEWHNIQEFSAIQGFNQLVNAGNARVKGLELSAAYRPVRAWTFAGAMSLIDGRLTSGNPVSGTQSGDLLPNTAKLSAVASIKHNFEIDSHRAFVALDEQYTGERHTTFVNNKQTPDFVMPSYAITNLQAGIDFGTVSVSMFARNLFNRTGIRSASSANVPLGGYVLAAVLKPRTIGVQATVSF